MTGQHTNSLKSDNFGWSFPSNSWKRRPLRSNNLLWQGKLTCFFWVIFFVSPKSLGLTNQFLVPDLQAFWRLLGRRLKIESFNYVFLQQKRCHLTRLTFFSTIMYSNIMIMRPYRLAFTYLPKTSLCFMAWNCLVCPGNHGGKVGGFRLSTLCPNLVLCIDLS